MAGSVLTPKVPDSEPTAVSTDGGITLEDSIGGHFRTQGRSKGRVRA